jgi:hypothetical protein
MGKLSFFVDGVPKEAYLGEYLQMCFVAKMKGVLSPLRQSFDIFDEITLGESEKELKANCLRLRAFIQTMITKRRDELKDPNAI